MHANVQTKLSYQNYLQRMMLNYWRSVMSTQKSGKSFFVYFEYGS